jgi:mediator of RNA polymerase II transcription subunit 14
MEGNLALGDSCPKMPLPLLIDFIIQKTYHDLSVLGELLHMKSDMERKIEIYNFANTASLRFSRLLALVKWTSKNLKIVDKSASVIAFLDRQSILFEQTANNLFEMRKGTLENARLPNAHIPAAVEVLITGTYSRLPLCIKAIVPPEPISAGEKKNTFLKLNQVNLYLFNIRSPPARVRRRRKGAITRPPPVRRTLLSAQWL